MKWLTFGGIRCQVVNILETMARKEVVDQGHIEDGPMHEGALGRKVLSEAAAQVIGR